MKSDVIIIGGGVIGLIAALAIIKNTSLTVSLIDEKLIHKPNTASLSRVSAITKRTEHFLKSLNVWERIPSDKISPFNKMSIWEEDHNKAMQFSAHDIRVDALGFIIENEVLSTATHDLLKEHERFNFDVGSVNVISTSDQQVSIVASNKEFRANLLIAADGAHSFVRQQLGIACQYDDYRMNAIVATVRSDKPHNKTARQRFLQEGPLAFLPLSDPTLSSIVWSQSTETVATLMALAEEEFNLALTDSFQEVLGSIKLVSQRIAFPLFRQQALQYIGKRAILIGDAAHVVHPLAGQGLNLGVSDVMVLQQVLQSTIEQDKDISTHLTLRKYERKAKAETYLMVKAIDLIYQSFINQHSRLQGVRKLGAAFIESSGFLKKQIMRFATGIP